MSTAKCFLRCGELPCFFSETGSPVGQNSLELTSCCSWGGPSCVLPTCWNGRCVPPHLVYTVFEKWREGFLVQGKHSANLLPSSTSRLLFERHFVLISRGAFPSRRPVQRLGTFKSYPGTFLGARIWGGLEWFQILYLPNFKILLVVWKFSSALSPPLAPSRLHRTALVLSPGMNFECWCQQRGSEVSSDPLSWLARLQCSTLSSRHCCFVCSLWEHRSSAAFVTWVAILLSFVLFHLLKFFSI